MQDQTEQALLAQLAERAGIAKDYYDIAGTLHHTSDDTRRAILTAMGYAIESAASLTQALQEWDEAPWQRPCDPVRILREGETERSVSCYLALEDGKEGSVAVEWQIRDEANAVVREGQGRDARTHYRVRERFRAHTVVECRLETGRTHQIRVHMAYVKHPLIGDPLYGGSFKLPKAADTKIVIEAVILHQVAGTRVQIYSAIKTANTAIADGDILANIGADAISL